MVRIMYLSPVAHRAGHDELFAEMARDYKLEGTEVHVTSLPDDVGSFSHIEFRSYE
ncbi:MAG: hydantoin racemase, partial [Boseongicola sp. SB0677_bin_26]|nr:hydantoin racemase [Boseongicola sp. SB0677_bin_26]